MEIKLAETQAEKDTLDQLLWDVLWGPLGFERYIRQLFKLGDPQTEIIAVADDVVVGGLVANRVASNEIEIRHMAVKPDFQKRQVGKRLVQELLQLVKNDSIDRISIYARNSSMGFYEKQGFVSIGGQLEHPGFTKHGIVFQQMYLEP